MNRKRYEEQNREFRQINAAYTKLNTGSSYEREANTAARMLLIMGMNKFFVSRTAGESNYDHLKYRRLDKNENRMAGHPTPNLKGI